MASSSLSVISGETPQGDPLSCSIFSERAPFCLWTWPPQELSAGDLLIDYPFSESFPQLEQNTTDPALASDVLARITTCISDLVQEGARCSLNPFACEWVLRELLTNATQYGGVRSSKDSCGIVRLEWAFPETECGSEFQLAVSHACPALFDPTRYVRMGVGVIDEVEEGGFNGHVGTAGILPFLKEGSSLCYLWRLPDGEYVGLFARQSSAQEKQLSSQAIERTVVRWDAQGTPLPYTVAEFEINVANGLQTDKVTVACVVGN